MDMQQNLTPNDTSGSALIRHLPNSSKLSAVLERTARFITVGSGGLTSYRSECFIIRDRSEPRDELWRADLVRRGVLDNHIGVRTDTIG